MRTKACVSLLSVALLVTACASTPQAATVDVASQWRQQVVDISAADDTAGRGLAIKQRLSLLGLKAREQAFVAGELKGSNLFADLGGPTDAPLLLIGAHYDRVKQGRGATDNASGSAAVLELAAALKARPLRHHRVAIAFWDLEERGLLGAKAYVADGKSEKPALYVNFDVFGWGDTLWMMRPTATPWLDVETMAAAKANAFALSAGEQYPPTDHLAFLQKGWPAVSFSLVGGDEIDGILAVFKGQQAQSGTPKVMEVIHNDRDTVDEIDATHVPTALRTVEDALRAWDASSGK